MKEQSIGIQLPAVQDPHFQLQKTGKLRRVYWTVLEAFGADVEQSREEYLAGQFRRALSVFSSEVDQFGAVVDGLRSAYTALTTSLREDEQRIRAAEAALAEPYSSV